MSSKLFTILKLSYQSTSTLLICVWYSYQNTYYR